MSEVYDCRFETDRCRSSVENDVDPPVEIRKNVGGARRTRA